MKQKKEKKKVAWGKYISLVLFMLAGAVCGVMIAETGEEYVKESGDIGQLLFQFAFLLIGLSVIIIAQTIIHEAGHLVCGLLSGYKFVSFRIMSFMWIKREGKIHFCRFSLTGTGGQCLLAPPDPVDGEIPVFLYNFGGAIANILASGLGCICACLFHDIQVANVLSWMFVIMGVVLAANNGIPMRLGEVNNDGHNAFEMSQNKDAQRAFWVQMKVNEYTSNGKRLKEMPEEWFTLPSDEEMKNSMIATIGVFACNRMVDEHQFEEADKQMKHFLEIESGIVGIYRNLMICDRMYMEMIAENRKEVLDEMYTKEQKNFMKAMKQFPSVLRTEYAYALLVDKDSKKAQKYKKNFEKYAKTYPYPNDIQSERELMEIAEKQGK